MSSQPDKLPKHQYEKCKQLGTVDKLWRHQYKHSWRAANRYTMLGGLSDNLIDSLHYVIDNLDPQADHLELYMKCLDMQSMK